MLLDKYDFAHIWANIVNLVHTKADAVHTHEKEDITGIENVENKSSETIRDEITKDNVTTALGYTPPEIAMDNSTIDEICRGTSGDDLGISGATTITEGQFSGRADLTNIIIPDSITSIGNNAFSSCSNLTSVVIPSSVESVGQWAFMSCSALADVTIEEGVQSIGMAAFCCTNITNIVFPSTITNLGGCMFEANPAMSTITLLSTTPPTIASDTFEYVEIGQIVVPAGCSNAYKSATNWSKYADLIIEASEDTDVTIEGNFYLDHNGLSHLWGNIQNLIESQLGVIENGTY